MVAEVGERVDGCSLMSLDKGDLSEVESISKNEFLT